MRERRVGAEKPGIETRGSLLDAVRGVKWPALRPVTGALPGAHHSRLRGSAPELSEYRVYRQGDDPRRIDWRLLARSDRVYICLLYTSRAHETGRNLVCRLLLEKKKKK